MDGSDDPMHLLYGCMAVLEAELEVGYELTDLREILFVLLFPWL